MTPNLNIVPFVSVDHMMKLVLKIGVERFLTELASYIRRWQAFDKTPRGASHSVEGVIELMPTSDGEVYGFNMSTARRCALRRRTAPATMA